MGWTMAAALLRLMFVSAEVLRIYPEITLYYTQQRLHRELHDDLKAVVFLQVVNWAITSFSSKEREILTSLILFKFRLKEKSNFCNRSAFYVLLFSATSCLIYYSVWTPVLNITLPGVAEQWPALVASPEHGEHSWKKAVGCFWLLTGD